MKIIGQVSRELLIVQMSRDELARIYGVRWEGDIPGAQTYSDNRFSPGVEYAVAEMWLRLTDQERAASRLAATAKELRALADLVEYKAPEVKLVTGDQQ